MLCNRYTLKVIVPLLYKTKGQNVSTYLVAGIIDWWFNLPPHNITFPQPTYSIQHMYTSATVRALRTYVLIYVERTATP